MPIKYPFLNLATVNAHYASELKEACARIIDSGRYIGGLEVESFERELAAYVGTRHAVGCASGLDALKLILSAYIITGQLHPGDKVIVPANTFFATVLAVTSVGLTPLLVDPDPDSHNLDIQKFQQSHLHEAKAVITVHLYGRPCQIPQIKSFAEGQDMIIIEDAAQAIGAEIGGVKAGALGQAGAFSFYPTKNIGALGDAGAITTDSDQLAEIIKSLRNYGSATERYKYDYTGLNSRLDPIQAAMLRVKLRYIEAETEGRRVLAHIYDTEIENPAIITPSISPGRHVYHQYVIRVRKREKFRAFLSDHGIDTEIHYPVPPHMQKCYENIASELLPVTEMLANEVVSLPISPACTSPSDAKYIARTINLYKE